MKSIFIFRNDLRIFDNTALIEASKNSNIIYPIFIFNKKQFSKEENKFYNEKIVKFMIECLEDLKIQISEKNGSMNFFYGENEKILESILKKNTDIKKVFVNKDYTNFSIKRDEKLKKVCEKNNCEFLNFDDRLLNEPNKILKDDKKPYCVFTPYYNKAKTFRVEMPNDFEIKNFSNKKIENEFLIDLNEVKKINKLL